MLAAINDTDITEYINEKSYKMNAEKDYDSWLDGNRKEHRIYTRPKVKGSFEVALYGKNNMLTQNFLDLWDSAVNNEIITMLVFVQNTNKMEAIEAYFEFTGKSHKKMVNGNYCDILIVKITER